MTEPAVRLWYREDSGIKYDSFARKLDEEFQHSGHKAGKLISGPFLSLFVAHPERASRPISAFMLMNCWSGLRHAQQLLRIARLPRREGFACPSCRTKPPLGAYWQCGQCRQPFDTFQTQAVCPHCGAQFATTRCLDCGEQHPMNEWMVSAFAGVGMASGRFSAR